MRRCLSIASRLVALALVATSIVPSTSDAQIALTNATAPTLLDQATPLAKGTFRFRATTTWSRIDGWFDSSGTSHALGSQFSSDSAGSAQIPALVAYEAFLQPLTGTSGQRFSLGHLTTAATARIATVPLAVDYGLTSRLTLSVVVPFVQTRSRLGISLNNRKGDTAFANVGVSPRDYATYSTVSTDFANAGAALAAEIQNCQANPGDPNCAAIDANTAGATTLAATLQQFATGVSAIYGTDASSNPGLGFIPLSGSSLMNAISARYATLNQAYQQYMGQAASSTALPGATDVMATGDLDQLLANRSVAGYDSLGTVERIWIGDVELGATWQIVAPTSDSTRAFRWRSSLQGVLRLPTGKVSDGSNPFDIGTGDGRTEVDARALLDAALGAHFALSLGGQYTAGFGTVQVALLPTSSLQYGSAGPFASATWTQGNSMQLDASPRFLVTDELSLDGYYSIRKRGDDLFTSNAIPLSGSASVTVAGATEQRLGMGFGYAATPVLGGVPLPLDARFVHLETIAASGGPAFKTSRDEVRVRIYY